MGASQEVVVAEGSVPGVVEERKVDHLQPSREGQGEKKHALAYTRASFLSFAQKQSVGSESVMLENGFGCRTAKVASRLDEKANSSVCPGQPDGIGGGGGRGKSDSRLHESTIFEERTTLKITSPRGGGGGMVSILT